MNEILKQDDKKETESKSKEKKRSKSCILKASAENLHCKRDINTKRDALFASTSSGLILQNGAKGEPVDDR